MYVVAAHRDTPPLAQEQCASTHRWTQAPGRRCRLFAKERVKAITQERGALPLNAR